MDPGPRPTDDEIDGIVAQLRDAGLLALGIDAEGLETWTLTLKAEVARWSAMGDAATLNAIVDAVEAGAGTSWTTRPAVRSRCSR